MAVIDMREDLRGQMALSGSIGQGIGAGIQAYRRQKTETEIIRTVQSGVAEGLTPEQIRENCLKIRNLVDEDVKQIRARYEASLRQEYLKSRTRYIERDPYEGLTEDEKKQAIRYKAGLITRAGTGGDMTQYKALETQRDNLQKRFDLADDESEAERLNQMISRIDSQMDAITNQMVPQAQPTREPVPEPFQADVDAVTGDFPVTGKAPQQTKPIATDPAAAAMEGPGDQLDIRQAFSVPGLKPSEFAQAESPQMPTRQQAKADAAIAKELTPATPPIAGGVQAEPPTQEYFEQMVTQIAQTDRAAAKEYYDLWVKKWQ